MKMNCNNAMIINRQLIPMWLAMLALATCWLAQSCSITEEEKLERQLQGCWTSESNAFNGITFINDSSLPGGDIEVSAISFRKDGSFEILTKTKIDLMPLYGFSSSDSLEIVTINSVEGRFYASSPGKINFTELHTTNCADITDEMLQHDLVSSLDNQLVGMTETEQRKYLIDMFVEFNKIMDTDTSLPGIELEAEIDKQNLHLSSANWMGESGGYFAKARSGFTGIRNKHSIRPVESYKRDPEVMADIVLDAMKK